MANVTITPNQIKPLVGSTVEPRTAAVAMTVGDLVYPSGDDNVNLTDADTAATVSGLVGIIVAGGRHEPSGAIIAGERVTVLWFGRVYLGDSANLDRTKAYFVSNTAAKLSDTPGTNPRRVGAPETSRIFFWNPGMAGMNS